MSNKHDNNIISTIVILFVIFAVCYLATPDIFNTSQVNSYNRQARLNAVANMRLQKQQQRLAQQQEQYELRTARAETFWNGIKAIFIFVVWCLAFALLIYVAMRLVKYTRHVIATTDFDYLREKNWQEMTLKHDRQLAQIHVKQIKAEQSRGMFEGLSLSGNLSYHPINQDSHDTQHSFTTHTKAPKSLSESLKAIPTFDANFAPIVQLPTFNEALNDSPNQSLVLGFDETIKPIYGTWSDLFSFGVGGASGSGKTSTAVWLLAQAVKQGAKLVVIDPHAGNPDSLATKLEPLSNSYLCNVATSQDEMLASINYAQNIFDNRKAGLDFEKTKVVICVDEWLACMRGETQEAFQTLAEAISQEGRKYNLIGCFLSQKWAISKSGDMRDTLTAHIITRSRPNLARQQTGLSSQELPSDVMSLKKGEFYLLKTTGELQKLRAPYVSQNDLYGIASSLRSDTSRILPHDSLSTSLDLETVVAPIGFGSNVEVKKEVSTAEEANIIQMFKSGKSISEITREVSGVQSGRKYSTYLKQVNDVLRKEIR